MKIYISGQITGLDIDKVHNKFQIVENEIIANGNEAVNPMKILTGNHSWVDYMKADLIELFKCDAIYMLSDWQNSRGAKLEYHIANEVGLQIIFE